MDETIDTLLVDVRASTDGFRSDIEAMRSTFDTTLVDGFAQAGDVLERGLLSAIRRGSLGFDDLKRVALRALDEIAAQAVQIGLDRIFSGAGNNSAGSAGGGFGAILGTALQAFLGSPGRATGGNVSPGVSYLVGERGPEFFVPTSAGRIETQELSSRAGSDLRVAINVSQPRGVDTPVALRRSARQVASAIRRAVAE